MCSDLVAMPGGGPATEPPEDDADRYEGAAERALDALGPCPHCHGRIKWDAGDLDCTVYPPLLAVACPCGLTARVPIL